MTLLVMIRGGGDLASGVAARLIRVGMGVFITELSQPLAVRRTVSFAQAVYDGQTQVEDVRAKLVSDPASIREVIGEHSIAVIIDPEGACLSKLEPNVIVDGRMTKIPALTPNLKNPPFRIGLGPGFTAGGNSHAVVETMRGPNLGRVYWQGSATADTGLPEPVRGHQGDRVLRALVDGVMVAKVAIGSVVDKGEVICKVGAEEVRAPFRGLVRGLVADGIRMSAGSKIGDLDPRLDRELTTRISDKALAIGGGVLEAILSRADLRSEYCR